MAVTEKHHIQDIVLLPMRGSNLFPHFFVLLICCAVSGGEQEESVEYGVDVVRLLLSFIRFDRGFAFFAFFSRTALTFTLPYKQ